jgi:ParB/RepB/Spo0J family partition protein
MSQSVKQVARGDIECGRNIRQQLRKAMCQELYLSIKQHGIQVPLLLEPGDNRPYRIVDGEHRFVTAEQLGLDYLPAIVLASQLTDAERTERQLIINSQRSDLTPIEKALAIKALMDAAELNASDAAGRLGSHVSTVSKYLSLLTLPVDIQADVSAGRIPFTHAYAISQNEDPAEQRALAAKSIERQLAREQMSRSARRSEESKTKADAKPTSRITLQLPANQRLTLCGGVESLDSFAELLSSVAARARKSARGGCDLRSFVGLINAEVRAGA